MATQCTGTTRSGSQCSLRTSHPSKLCPAHRQQAQSDGQHKGEWGKRLTALGEAVSVVRNLILTFFIFFVVVVLGALVVSEARTPSLIVSPISAPGADGGDTGYTPEVLAARVVAELARIDRVAAEFAVRQERNAGPRFSISDDKTPINVQIYEDAVSFRTLVQFVKILVGTPDVAVRVDITLSRPPADAKRVESGNGAQTDSDEQSGGSYIAHVRVLNGGTMTGAEPIKWQRSNGLDGLTERIAEEAMRVAAPYVLVDYMISNQDESCRQKSVSSSCDYSVPMSLLDKQLLNDTTDDRKRAYVAKSGIMIRMQDYEGAITAARRATLLDNEFGPAYFNWVNALLGKNDFQEAEKVAQLWQRATPEDPVAYEYLGTARAANKNCDGAISAFRNALWLDPQHDVVYVLWGNLLVDQKKFTDAQKKYILATRADPDDAAAFGRWGQALLEQKAYALAIEKAQRAVDLDAGYALPYQVWGSALVALGNEGEAVMRFAQAETRGASVDLEAWRSALIRNAQLAGTGREVPPKQPPCDAPGHR